MPNRPVNTPYDLDQVFKMIEAVALAGGRCPQRQPYGSLSGQESDALLMLAGAGRLRIDIYAHNWRVITICEGPHAGTKTALPPGYSGQKSNRTFEKGYVRPSDRPRPSAPRLMPYAGRDKC